MRKAYWAAGVCSAVVVLFVGNFHLFTGSGLLPRVVPRVTFSFSEFVVNTNALVEMSAAMRATHYPLSSMALDRYWSKRIDKAREIAK